MYTGCCWGNRREGDNWVDRWIFRKWDVEVWTGLSWLMTGTVGGHV